MECIEVLGGRPLYGGTCIQGSKNAALPIIAATILNKGTSVLHNCPRISDVICMSKILESIGCSVRWEGSSFIVDASTVRCCEIHQGYAQEMRSSVIMLGGLLGRCKKARLAYPGGCVIGERPIDLHLTALEQMNVSVFTTTDLMEAWSDQICGAHIVLPFPSVGATENIILAAVLAEGTTYVENSAMEPEISELCGFLRAMGAEISGDGTDTICICGVKELHDVEYEIIADRIVAGTYMLAAAATKGQIYLERVPFEQLDSLLGLLARMGAVWKRSGSFMHLDARNANRPAGAVTTQPYPGFPTDLQSQLMAACSRMQGLSVIEERIFEARYKVAEQLRIMGADIELDGSKAVIRGGTPLYGREVQAQELRGGAALVTAGLCARGVTRIENRKFIDRGYEDISRDLRALGAQIT